MLYIDSQKAHVIVVEYLDTNNVIDAKNTLSERDLLVSQLVPSYPLSQVQLYLLSASVQIPPFRHGLLPHSFISRNTYC